MHYGWLFTGKFYVGKNNNPFFMLTPPNQLYTYYCTYVCKLCDLHTQLQIQLCCIIILLGELGDVE